MARVGIIGAGSWGTALSVVLCDNGHEVTLWSVLEDEIKMLKECHEQKEKLPGVKLSEDMVCTTDLEKTVFGMDILVLAVPSPFTRSTAAKMAPFVKDGQKIVNVALSARDLELSDGILYQYLASGGKSGVET